MIYICENILDLDVEKALRVVSTQRRDKALRYRFDIDRRQSLAAYMLLMYGLRKEYNIDMAPIFAYTTDGKPYIRGHIDIHFNLSHCHRAVACAISNYPIGVDIEAIAPIDWHVARRVMNDAQLRHIESSAEPERSFTQLWTMKESLLKLTGEGLCDDLPRLAIDTQFFTHHHAKEYVCTACYSTSEQDEAFSIVTL